MLEQAVLRFALDFIVARGFVPMSVPHLVRDEAMVGTAYFPGGEEQAYAARQDELNLVGTAEVPVTGYHTDEILERGPPAAATSGYSTCFRREAGTYGKDTRGLYRVHQFQKVEQVDRRAATTPRSRRASTRRSSGTPRSVLQALELPYRVV